MKKLLIRFIKSLTVFLIKMKLLSPLVIVRVDGGIASQMHFYLVGMLFKEKGYRVKFDLSWFKSNGRDLEGTRVRNFDLLKAFPYLEFEEISLCDSIFFAGFKYVNQNKSLDFIGEEPPIWLLSYYPYTKDMLDVMMPKYFHLDADVLDDYSKNVYNQIKEKDYPVAVHVRRGDLATYNSAYGSPVSNSYFARSMDFFQKNMDNPFFFFFSDEMDWVENNLLPELDLDGNYMLVNGNSDDKGYMDMFLISVCSSQITSKGSLGKYGGFIHAGKDNIIVVFDDNVERDKWGGLSDKLFFVS